MKLHTTTTSELYANNRVSIEAAMIGYYVLEISAAQRIKILQAVNIRNAIWK